MTGHSQEDRLTKVLNMAAQDRRQQIPVGEVRLAFKPIKSVKDLPPYRCILSGHGRQYKFEVADSLKTELAILETADNTCVLVITDRNRNSHTFNSFRERIRVQGYTIEIVLVADGGLISALYQNTSQNVNLESAGQSDPVILRELDELLQIALCEDVSDIHIEKRDDKAYVKMRQHGELYVLREWGTVYASRFFRAIHAAADDESKETTFSEMDSQQMSVTRTAYEGKRIKLRVQTVVAYPDGSMDMVMRILKMGSSSEILGLSHLGYEPHHTLMLEYMNSSPSGAVIIAGTTGSGKSTTIMNMMHNIRMANPSIKMYSVEDPPEYILRGVTQIPVVRRKNDMTNPFARTMRDAMRADPDVLMVGEVRDPESAACLVSMVQSGHKVLTTVHAASSLGIPERLEKMGMDLQTIASKGFISGLIFQTLVQTLCPHCREPWTGKNEYGKTGLIGRVEMITQGKLDNIFVRGKGCPHCKNLAITGRTVCAEMVIPDLPLLKMLRQGDFNQAYEYWRSQRHGPSTATHGMNSMAGRTALDHALLKMIAGQISPIDVESALGHITGDQDDIFTDTKGLGL